MLVSIIVTNFNYGRYLTRCIESALGQTYENREIIVVDDGSSDNSREIMSGYGDRIIPVYKENGGQGSAANAGFARARGDLVLFLDADDFLYPHALETAANAWEPGLAKLQAPMDLVNSEGHKLGTRYPLMLHDGDVTPIIRKYLDYASTPTSGNVFSRQVLDQLFPLDESSTRTGLDYQVSCLAAFHGRIGKLDTPLASYRLHMSADALLANHQYKTPVEHLLRNARVREALREELVRRGFIGMNETHTFSPYELRSRMVSLASEPAAYPYKEETRIGIAIQGTRAALEWPGYKTLSRLVLIGWLWIIALSPAPAAKTVIRWGVIPVSRPWPIRLLARLMAARRN